MYAWDTPFVKDASESHDDINSLDEPSLRRYCALLDKINKTSELDELLDVLGAEIKALKLFDAYLINLIDKEQSGLICEKIKLPSGYQNVESTYLKYKFGLESNFVNAESYNKNKSIILNKSSVENYEAHVRNRFQRWRIHQLIVVPLIDTETNTPLGTIMAFRQNENLDPSSEKVLVNLVKPFIPRLKANCKYNELKKKQSQIDQFALEQEQFLQFVTTINNLTTSEAIYETISYEFLKLMPFEHVSVMMRDNDKIVCKRHTLADKKHASFCASWDNYLNEHPYELDITDGATPTVILNNTHLYFPDVIKVRHLPMSEKDKNGLDEIKTPRTFLFIPIRHNNEAIGLIWLITFTKTVNISNTEIEFAERLCHFIGTAIKNAELYDLVAAQKNEIEDLNDDLKGKVEELAEIASHDKLTGLHNYRYFEIELDRKVHEYTKNPKAKLSLVIVDIDHFKRFNDHYGHEIGNTVLSNVGSVITHLSRSNDIACRYGGEEFVIILPRCGEAGAHQFAERLRKEIEKTQFSSPKGELNITVSAGCATLQMEETRNTFFARADQALYLAKENGRNRTEVSNDSSN